jgi:hypothetical protein
MSVFLARREVETRGSQFKASPGKKIGNTLSQKPSCAWWYTTVTPATFELEVGGLWSEVSSGQEPNTI